MSTPIVHQQHYSKEMTVRPGANGGVEISFFHEGQQFVFFLKPEEASAYTSLLLKSMKAAAWQSGKDDNADPTLGPISSDLTVAGSSWRFGSTENPAQKVIVLTVGESHVPFTVADEHLRALGRALVVSSWQKRTPLSAHQFLAMILKDFAGDFRSWLVLCKERTEVRLRDYSNRVWTFLRGRSLWVFFELAVGPEIGPRKYAPVGKCIYCGSLQYSDRPHLELRRGFVFSPNIAVQTM